MIDKQDFSIFIDKLLRKNLPFAAWFMPGDFIPEILIGADDCIDILPDATHLNDEEGFVFAPYRLDEDAPLLLLKPGILLKGYKKILAFDVDSLMDQLMPSTRKSAPFIISKNDYLRDINATIETIQKTKLAKVIVSRLISVERENEPIGTLLLKLKESTPNAMVYLVNLPGAGVWMGATPEILLKSEGKTFETVSLAGTQSRRNDGDYSWRTKEIEEQAFVSRYLLDLFYKFNIHPYTTQGPETLASGKVAHLSTSFRFSAKKLTQKLGDFIHELHPTPAVCGLPKSRADRYISKIEKHNRRYYTGFLGPWRLNESVRLFVNLRCMEILDNKYILYVGGGITSRSVPEDEWEETNKKAQTLLSAIEAVQNK